MKELSNKIKGAWKSLRKINSRKIEVNDEQERCHTEFKEDKRTKTNESPLDN